MNGPWLQTMDGGVMQLLAPLQDSIHLTTLSIVLSRTCRFGGHTNTYYSVADHSLRVHEWVSGRTADPHIRLAALLHDGHEAYSGFGDVCQPVRVLFPRLSLIEDGIDKVIAAKFGFDPLLFHHHLVRQADRILLATEARDLMRPPPRPWDALPDPLPERITPRILEESAWDFESRVRNITADIDPERRIT